MCVFNLCGFLKGKQPQTSKSDSGRRCRGALLGNEILMLVDGEAETDVL